MCELSRKHRALFVVDNMYSNFLSDLEDKIDFYSTIYNATALAKTRHYVCEGTCRSQNKSSIINIQGKKR